MVWLLALLGLGACAHLLVAEPRALDLQALWLVLQTGLLEVTAPPLPAFGYLSLAFAGPAALALRGQLRAAAVAVALALVLRTVRSGRWREALAEAVTAWLTLEAFQLGLPAPLAGVLFLLLAWAIPALLGPPAAASQVARRWETAPARLLVPLLGWLQSGELAACLCVTPCLGVLQLLLKAPPQPEAHLQRLLVESEARFESLSLGRESAALERHRLLQELSLLESLSRSLAQTPNLQTSLDTVLEAVAGAAPCSSCAILAPDGEALAARTDQLDRLESARLLGLEEPVVKAAWAGKARLEARPEQLQGERIFSQEKAAMAFYLEAGAVLYWGAAEPPSEHQVQLLSMLADLASVALQAGRQRDELAASLAHSAQAAQRHQHWVERLVTLLDGLRDLVASPDPSSLLPDLARRCVPHDSGLVRVADKVHAWGGEPPEDDILDRALEHGRPLLLDKMLVVSAPEERTVVLLRRETEFVRDDLTLVGLMAFLVGMVYRRVETQQQLVQASKLGAVGQLAAGVAHELNTPLGAIQLAMDGIKPALMGGESSRGGGALPPLDRQLGSALKRWELADAARVRCQEIIGQLLVFCRSDAERQRIDLNEVLAETLLLLRSQLARSGVTLTSDLGEIGPIQANRNDLQQVLSNLLLNAAYAVTSPGARAPALAVRTWRQGSQVCLSVTDQGPGMAPEILARVFEPFYTTKPVGKGTGLGLSISREVMEKHGGRLELESRVGEGTRAWLSLPVAG